jgi:hypothetical protein
MTYTVIWYNGRRCGVFKSADAKQAAEFFNWQLAARVMVGEVTIVTKGVE